MKTIIAGSRTITDIRVVERAVKLFNWEDHIGEVVSGVANGVDALGEQWAKINNIPIKQFPADWEGLGKYAGIKRNADMAKYAEALLLVWDGESRGSWNMLQEAIKNRLEIRAVVLTDAESLTFGKLSVDWMYKTGRSPYKFGKQNL